jgi:hypothetical protein
MPDPRIMITARLPQSLLDRVGKYIEAHRPGIRDRTQLIEIALDKLLNRPSK